MSKARCTREQAHFLSHPHPAVHTASLALIPEQATRTGGLSLVLSLIRRHPGPLTLPSLIPSWVAHLLQD